MMSREDYIRLGWARLQESFIYNALSDNNLIDDALLEAIGCELHAILGGDNEVVSESGELDRDKIRNGDGNKSHYILYPTLNNHLCRLKVIPESVSNFVKCYRDKGFGEFLVFYIIAKSPIDILIKPDKRKEFIGIEDEDVILDVLDDFPNLGILDDGDGIRMVEADKELRSGQSGIIPPLELEGGENE